MDILTQGLLGAALAQSVSRRHEHRVATVIGFLSGLLADADVLIRSNTDPLLTLEYHRHFTHSIFFIPLGALLVALLLWFFYRQRLAFKYLYFYSLAGYSFSGFIDLCTSYGTYYFWPLLDQRLSLNIISIIDPIFTLILIVGVLLVWFKSTPVFARGALVLCASYLLIGYWQQQRATDFAHQVIADRGHAGERILLKPSFANIILWRLVYIADGRIYVDAIRAGLSFTLYQGDSVPLFDIDKDLPSLDPRSVHYRDIERFDKFSDGYVARHPDNPDILGDIRYGMLPDSVLPLWGVELNLEQPQQHVNYDFYRDSDASSRQHFKQMLLGQ